MDKDTITNELDEIRTLIDFERHGDLFSTTLDECYERLTKILEELE